MNIGMQIKKLRRERDMTQENLAEVLNISVSAVSQWESGRTTPDISQIIPLAAVFGVSTDMLFGISASHDEEVDSILKNIYFAQNGEEKSEKEIYDDLQNALIRYPNNMKLLSFSLNYGMRLYDESAENSVYLVCIRQANLIISYSKDAAEILDASMKMVTLHAANGNSEEALRYARKFPWRCDFTVHTALAEISAYEKDFQKEAYHCQHDIQYFYDATLHSFTRLGEAYRRMGKYDDALRIFELVFSLIEVISVDESIMPVLHWTTYGDVHALIAKTYLAMNNPEKALEWLKKMVDYDETARACFKTYKRSEKAYLPDTNYPYYHWLDGDEEFLSAKLNAPEFEVLRGEERFLGLLERVGCAV